MSENLILNLGGSGGASLNFKIVGNPQPSNPAENTIWVDTDTAITGWAFSATEPDLIDGFVWISVGTSSSAEFNALKKNNITVYPVSAKQCIGGEWVTKTAKSYQNGELVDWAADTVLYNSGVFNEDVAHFSSKTPDAATITYDTSYINMKTVANKASEIYEGFGPISIAGFSRLIAVLSNTSDKNIYGCVFASQSANALKATALAIVSESMDGRTNDLTVTLDLSDLSNAECYVYAGFHTNDDGWSYARSGLHVQSVKLEV